VKTVKASYIFHAANCNLQRINNKFTWRRKTTQVDNEISVMYVAAENDAGRMDVNNASSFFYVSILFRIFMCVKSFFQFQRRIIGSVMERQTQQTLIA
jgi:hypothetical protein